jgi:hypothetical protein
MPKAVKKKKTLTKPEKEGINKDPQKQVANEARPEQTITIENERKTKFSKKSFLLLVLSLTLLIIGTVVLVVGKDKIRQLDNNAPRNTNNDFLSTPQTKVKGNTIGFELEGKKDSKTSNNEHTILDFYTSKTRPNTVYIILSSNDNSYITAISEDEKVRERLLTKKLKIGQKVTIVSSKPIKFKVEPAEIKQVRGKLKRTSIVMLKDIEPSASRNF